MKIFDGYSKRVPYSGTLKICQSEPTCSPSAAFATSAAMQRKLMLPSKRQIRFPKFDMDGPTKGSVLFSSITFRRRPSSATRSTIFHNDNNKLNRDNSLTARD